MTASEKSVIGLAKQVAKGTPNVTHAEFSYFLFNQGNAGPQNLFLPLDQENGGGALLRGIVKTGVTSGGTHAFIPRPTSIGHMLMGITGVDTISGAGPEYLHTFTLPADQFTAPYYTFRSTPGGIWGEQYQDARIAALAFSWKAADYLRAQVAFLGGLPATNVSMTSWATGTYLDKGPQFLASKSVVELPTGTALKVLTGAVSCGMQIPLEDQWVTGAESPDDFDINQRIYTVTLGVKVVSAALYNQMNYDAAGGAAWVANIFKEGRLNLVFKSDVLADTGTPYALQMSANGQAGDNANVHWTATPVISQSGRQIQMVITGTFLASPTAAEPLTFVLTNQKATAY